MKDFDAVKEDFYQFKSKELKGIEVLKQELTLKEECLKKEKDKMQSILEKLEQEKSQLSDIQSKS
jgi:hypothetical protein